MTTTNNAIITKRHQNRTLKCRLRRQCVCWVRSEIGWPGIYNLFFCWIEAHHSSKFLILYDVVHYFVWDTCLLSQLIIRKSVDRQPTLRTHRVIGWPFLEMQRPFGHLLQPPAASFITCENPCPRPTIPVEPVADSTRSYVPASS